MDILKNKSSHLPTASRNGLAKKNCSGKNVYGPRKPKARANIIEMICKSILESQQSFT